jgi:hypothetical protein
MNILGGIFPKQALAEVDYTALGLCAKAKKAQEKLALGLDRRPCLKKFS